MPPFSRPPLTRMLPFSSIPEVTGMSSPFTTRVSPTASMEMSTAS